MELKDIRALYLHRQSCRAFDAEKKVDKELVLEACRTALLAPSACNAQPWKLIIVSGEKKDRLVTALQGMGMNKFASDAPLLIAVCEARGNFAASVGGKLTHNEFSQNDVGILTGHLVIALEAAGLASCILGWRNEEKIRELLSLSKETHIPEVIAVGYPKDGYEIRAKRRKDEEKTLIWME